MNHTPLQALMSEYYEVCGRIFGDYFVRQNANAEQMKSIEAKDFMDGIMTGNIKKEWKLEETEDYKLLIQYTEAINLLGTNNKTNEPR